MRPDGTRRLTIVLVLFAVAACAAVAHSAGMAGSNPNAHQEFQGLVGGLGFGPSLDLSHCAMCFDPRVDSSCQETEGPIPCGSYFCPQHACSIFNYEAPHHEKHGAHPPRSTATWRNARIVDTDADLL